jgi:hypothetical protein
MVINQSWGTDVVPSLPVPPTEPTVGTVAPGFAYSRFGLVHDLTTSDLEEYLSPTYLPIDAPEWG